MTKANKNTALTAAIKLALAGFAANNAHALEFGQRSVGGPVIDHDHLVVGVIELRQRLEAAAQLSRAREVGGNDHARP